MFETILSYISENGFAIVMCLLFWYDTREMRKDHKQEVDNLAKVISANTTVVERIEEVLHENRD